MADVDPTDDSIWRWVLSQYRFDPKRNERRYVTMAVFDNQAEFDRAFLAYAEKVRSEVADGTRPPGEGGPITGTIMRPGYLAEQARGHNIRRAIEHGVDPGPLVDSGPLPEGMAVWTWRPEDDPNDDSVE